MENYSEQRLVEIFFNLGRKNSELKYSEDNSSQDGEDLAQERIRLERQLNVLRFSLLGE